MLVNNQNRFYRGNSMHGTFQPGDYLIIIQVPLDQVRIGDIVVFCDLHADDDDNSYFVHRIMQSRADGFVTRGDNNSNYDSGYLTKDNYFGKVIYVSRKNKKRTVADGPLGFLRAHFLYTSHKCWEDLYRLIGGSYNYLRKIKLLPYFWRPTFNRLLLQSSDGMLVKYLIKGRTVANWWPQQNRYTCRKPFDLVLRDPRIK